MQSLITLGRQPALGLAELESLYGAAALTAVGPQAVLVNIPPDRIAFDRLGGAVKLGAIMHNMTFVAWRQIEKFLLQTVAPQAQDLPEGAIQDLRIEASLGGLALARPKGVL